MAQVARTMQNVIEVTSGIALHGKKCALQRYVQPVPLLAQRRGAGNSFLK